jgi:recombination protein RecA
VHPFSHRIGVAPSSASRVLRASTLAPRRSLAPVELEQAALERAAQLALLLPEAVDLGQVDLGEAGPTEAGPTAAGPPPVVEWAVAEWAPRGRLVELCAGPDAAQTSAAVMVLRETQREGDPVAWVMPRGAGLFPPDLAAAGLDLEALVVVHVPPEDGAAGPRAAELVLRTGAFGAVVLDLGTGAMPRGGAWQGRLLGLAREHTCRIVVLSPHGQARASLGPLVSLRFDVRRARLAPGRFCVEARALKDKSGLLGSREASASPCVPPPGAR